MDYLNPIYEWLINLPFYYWIISICFLSLMDSIISPVPPDPLIILSITYFPENIILTIILVTLSSYIGGLISYFLAIKIHQNYKNLINYFVSEEKFKKTNISDNVLIGSNSTILPVKVFSNIVIGAGSIVTEDLKIKGVYAGNPAKLIKRF